MHIERITGRSNKGGLILEDIDLNYQGTVQQTLDLYFPIGAYLDSGDSPYELAVYGKDDSDLGCLTLSQDEARAYLVAKHGMARAKAILGEYDRDWHESYIQPYT